MSCPRLAKHSGHASQPATCDEARDIAGQYFTSQQPARMCYAVKALPLQAKVLLLAAVVQPL